MDSIEMNPGDVASGRAVMKYCALIRTVNSAVTLPATIEALESQSHKPDAWVFVDSGSQDQTLSLLPPGATVHHYSGRSFNFSAALNQGLSHVKEDFVLVISSHTRLTNPQAIAYGLGLLQKDERLGGVYFCDQEPGPLCHEIIDAASFNGFNGLWNTCALVRASLLRERPFREEVFSAEDQEWTGWLLRERGGSVARIKGGGRFCDNPRATLPLKRMNEYVAVAYFVQPSLMEWGNIWRQVWLALGPGGRRELGRRYYLRLALRLAVCHFRAPQYGSRYFVA